MICLAMTSLAMPVWSLRPRATRAISNASPMTRLVSGSKLMSPRNEVMGINARRCRQEREGAHHRPAGVVAGGGWGLRRDFPPRRFGTRLNATRGAITRIPIVRRTPGRAAGPRGTEALGGAFAVRPDCGDRDA